MDLTCALAVLVITLIIYRVYLCDLIRFRRAGVIHKTPIPIFGNLAYNILRKVPLPDIMNELFNLNPKAKYFGFFELTTPIIIIRDTELINDITVRNFDHFPNHFPFIDVRNDPIYGQNVFSIDDDNWRKIRLLITPAFSPTRLKVAFELMSDYAKNFAQYLAEQPLEDSVVEMRDLCARYSNDVIATCAFGIHVDSLRDRNNAFWRFGKSIMIFDVLRSIRFTLTRNYPSFTGWCGMHLLDEKDRAFFKDVIESTIRTRDENNIYRPDFIQLLMETRKGDPEDSLTMDEIVAQALVIYIGGFDSVATTLTFLAYEVASNKSVYENLQNEIDSVNENCGGRPTCDAVLKMTYLDAVVRESLRLHPPARVLDRVCSKDYQLPPAVPGGKPYLLRKGDAVWCSVPTVLRDPNNFENPNAFNPNRFIGPRELIKTLPFIPFGDGPRICLGKKFAMMVAKLFLFHLLTKCQLSRCSKTPDPLVITGIFFSPKIDGGLWLDVRSKEKKLDDVGKNLHACRINDHDQVTDS